MKDDFDRERQPAVAVQRRVRQLLPDWVWESCNGNGGRIIGSCETPQQIAEMVKKLAEHPETDQIIISKRRRDYDPMIPVEKMQDIINSRGEDRKSLIRELSNNPKLNHAE